MNPHFIFNTLNSILYLINSDNKRAASQYLTDFSQLMRLVLEHSKQSFIPLQEDWKALKLYIRLEQLRISDKINVHLPQADIPEDIDFDIPPMLLQPLVENAFVHAFSAKEKGNLFVRWQHVKVPIEGFWFEVQDDGIGRQAAQKLRQKIGQSTALANLQARLEHINILWKTDFQFLFIDLMDEQNQAWGSLVRLFVPLVIL